LLGIFSKSFGPLDQIDGISIYELHIDGISIYEQQIDGISIYEKS